MFFIFISFKISVFSFKSLISHYPFVPISSFTLVVSGLHSFPHAFLLTSKPSFSPSLPRPFSHLCFHPSFPLQPFSFLSHLFWPWNSRDKENEYVVFAEKNINVCWFLLECDTYSSWFITYLCSEGDGWSSTWVLRVIVDHLPEFLGRWLIKYLSSESDDW